MPDDSLDQFVAQAVEPMPDIPDDSPKGSPPNYVIESPLRMWLWDQDAGSWYAGTLQESMDRSMRAYMLFWERTEWRLIQLRHGGPEQWEAILKRENLRIGRGSTAAIAICEAIKAASLVDSEMSKETEVRS